MPVGALITVQRLPFFWPVAVLRPVYGDRHPSWIQPGSTMEILRIPRIFDPSTQRSWSAISARPARPSWVARSRSSRFRTSPFVWIRVHSWFAFLSSVHRSLLLRALSASAVNASPGPQSSNPWKIARRGIPTSGNCAYGSVMATRSKRSLRAQPSRHPAS
jgi:hypothetical protein